MFDTELFELPPPSFEEVATTAEERALVDVDTETAPGLPSGVEAMTPGPVLAAFLSTVDPTTLSGFDLVNLLRAQHKQVAHAQAAYYATVAALADSMFDFDDDPELATHAAAMELRAALGLTRRMAGMELDFAYELTQRLPAVASALETGQVDVRRAKVLVNGTIHLEETQAREVVDRIIDRAGQLTTGELRARVRKLCIEVDPAAADKEYKSAYEQRKLVREPNLAGTATILLSDVAPNKAGRAMDRINQLAKSLHSPGETRTMDQLRADIALDLLCGNSTYENAKPGKVVINVDLDTLARLTEMPGDLGGYGPVIADIARQTTEQTNSRFQFRVTDPHSGQAVAAGTTTKRRHNTAQRRHVELRDPVCVFPGCRTPSTNCDLDHTKTWAETHETSADASAPLDRHDHTGRHQFGWTYQRLPDGDYLWKSRLGHYYTKSGRPPPKLE